MAADLQAGTYTADLFKQYNKHLGGLRFWILIEGQKLVVPQRVMDLLHLSGYSWLKPLVQVYKIIKRMKMDWMLKVLLLPQDYKERIRQLDVVPG
jgi:hypothetical protein